MNLNFSDDEFDIANKENVPPARLATSFNSPVMSTLSKLGCFEADYDFESVKKTKHYTSLKESFAKELKPSPPAKKKKRSPKKKKMDTVA